MSLLYLAMAYFVGIAAGRPTWQIGLFDCDFSPWLWTLPLALVPFAPLLNRLRPPSSQPSMRWPASAGFAPPIRRPAWALATALTLAFLAGGLRYASRPLTPCWTPADLAYYNASADRAFDRSLPPVTVTGYVSTYPLRQDTRQRLHLQVDSLTTNGVTRPVQGQLRMTTGARQHYRYGQRLQVTGHLVTPPEFETFSYREYLARKGVHSLLYSPRIEPLDGPEQGSPFFRLLYGLRRRGEVLVNRLLPEPHAALANGMLLGIESGIPDDLYEQFNLTGTSHVIVISGSNVAIVAGVLMALGTRLLGQRRAIWPTLAGIGAYALLVGSDAAVMRAALMGALYVVATALGRRSTALVSLAVACWAMTLVNPLTLWDVGFQLSSAATAGLILFNPGLTAGWERLWSRMRGRRPGSQNAAIDPHDAHRPAFNLWRLAQGLLQDGLIVTVAANLTTLPLVVHYFGRLSLVSLLTNLLIAPAQPYIMLWGGAGVIAGLVGLLPVAQVLLWIPWLCLAWTVTVVRWTANLPGASLEIAGYGLTGLALTYGLLFAMRWRTRLGTWLGRLQNAWSSGLQMRRLGPGAVAGLGVGVVLVWTVALSQPDGYLHVHFLDVGQGDGTLIQTPSGRQVLIDGGSSPQALLSELGGVMPFWDRSLDLLVMSHPDLDHMGAQVELPARYRIDAALESAAAQAHEDDDGWQEAMAAANVPVHIQERGGWLDLGDGVALWVLWPGAEETQDGADDDKNDRSLVLRLVYGEFTVLLTGDAGLPVESALMDAHASLAAQVLKVGHHGSRSSTGPAFVQAVNPLVAVIQVGENRYGHPHEEVLEALAGRSVLRNDRHGRVHVYSDGRHMWLEAERVADVLTED